MPLHSSGLFSVWTASGCIGKVMSTTYEKLLEKVRAGWESRIILRAVELGVAEALSDAELTASEVADRLGRLEGRSSTGGCSIVTMGPLHIIL